MNTPRQYLICDSLAHASVCDLLACEYFRDVDGNKGAQWSGIFAKPGLLSDTYAILWESQLTAVFGPPEEDPLLVIETEEIDEAGESNWLPLPPPEPEEGEI